MREYAKHGHAMVIACVFIKNAATRGDAVCKLIAKTNCIVVIIVMSHGHMAMFTDTNDLTTGGSTLLYRVAMLSAAMDWRAMRLCLHIEAMSALCNLTADAWESNPSMINRVAMSGIVPLFIDLLRTVTDGGATETLDH